MSKSKINTKLLSGFVELLPDEQIVFDKVFDIVRSTYLRSGYFSIDTPVMEKSDVLLAKAGGETEKQIYRFSKGDNDLSLRFDLTVPFSRYVSEHYNDLLFPFKKFQIGKVYRGERAQKGRYREFYQADIDIVSKDSLSNMCSVDVISTIVKTLLSLSKQFNLGSFTFKISDRRILDAVFDILGLTKDIKDKLILLIDKRHKISSDDFEKELSSLLNNDSLIILKKLFDIKFIPGLGVSVKSDLKDFEVILKNENILLLFKELENILTLLSSSFPDVNFELDFSVVRGLDYYTGIVFETFFEEYLSVGSVASGGRYDNLCCYYSDNNILGVGGSIGLSRLFIPLIEAGIINKNMVVNSNYRVLIIPYDESCFSASYSLNNIILSNTDIISSVLYKEYKIKKSMEYANKLGVNFVIILGEEEVKNSLYTLKNMLTGEQVKYSAEDLVRFFNSKK